MSKVERTRAEKLGNIPWLIFLAWWGWTILRGENVNFGSNPVKILMFGIVIVFVGHAITQIIWLFNNPFALIDKGDLIICPSPFQKETIKIEAIVQIRETLSLFEELRVLPVPVLYQDFFRYELERGTDKKSRRVSACLIFS